MDNKKKAVSPEEEKKVVSLEGEKKVVSLEEEKKVVSLAETADGANKKSESKINERDREESIKSNSFVAIDNEWISEEANVNDGLQSDPPRLSISATESKFRRMRHSSVGPQIEMPNLKFPSAQVVLIIMAFLAFLNIYCLRVDISVAIVAMINNSAFDEHHPSNASACGPLSSEAKKEDGKFTWNSNEQGVVLSAFYYGYIVTNIIGGTLAQMVGGKFMLLFGVFWTSILTLLTPICTEKGGLAAIVIVRVLEGLGEGVTYPSMHVLISRWAAPSQRSKIATAVYAGAQMGAVITMPLAGALCALSQSGWHYVFYVFGAMGIVWSIFWVFLVFDSPEKHPRIEEAELKYIQTSLAGIGGKQSLKLPWKAIATSVPVYALAVAHFSSNWGYYLLISALPTYMKTILGFDIKSNGLLSGLPYFLSWMCMIGAGYTADTIRTRGLMSTTGVRKLCIFIGFIVPAGLLIGTGLIGCNKATAVTFVTLAIGINGISMAGWGVNHLDLAPPYAGTLMGITNTIATIPGMTTLSVVGAFTYKNQTVAAWQNIFYLTASVNVAGTIFYLTFGSGKRQAWGSPPETNRPPANDLTKKSVPNK